MLTHYLLGASGGLDQRAHLLAASQRREDARALYRRAVMLADPQAPLTTYYYLLRRIVHTTHCLLLTAYCLLRRTLRSYQGSWRRVCA